MRYPHQPGVSAFKAATTILALFLALLFTLGVLGAILSACAGPPAATKAAPGPNGRTQAPHKALSVRLEDSFPGNGTFFPRRTIKPGTYSTTATGGTDSGFKLCSWARLSDLRGRLDSVILSGNFSEGRRTVVIEPGDYAFATEGCNFWKLVKSP